MTTPPGVIRTIYISLDRRPYRFVIRRRISGLRESYEVSRPTTLGDFVADLLRVLSENSPTFMESLAQVDDREFMASKHKSRRYIADRKDLLYIDNPRLSDKFARSQSGNGSLPTSVRRKPIGSHTWPPRRPRHRAKQLQRLSSSRGKSSYGSLLWAIDWHSNRVASPCAFCSPRHKACRKGRDPLLASIRHRTERKSRILPNRYYRDNDYFQSSAGHIDFSCGWVFFCLHHLWVRHQTRRW